MAPTVSSTEATSTVLVVDDNEANRLLAQGALEDEGYRVVLAGGGAEGVAAFKREAPDCVLLDVRMPEVDGFTACERIRKEPRGLETPILFLTAARDIDTFERAIRAGGDDFLTKPMRPTELVVRVQTALKLRRLRSELHEHYALLKQQRDDVMRLQLEKERLMAFVVHDLKNPVSAMDLHAQLVMRDRHLSETAKNSAQQIRAEARQLNRMILTLLDVSKAEEGKLVPKRVKVAFGPLVAEVFTELEAAAARREVRLVSALEASEVYADADLLRRVLANLVDNAVRHAPAASAVTVASTVTSDAVELRVSDEGPGVPVELRPRVFEAFVQATGGALQATGGRGLGLTFCKLTMVAHGGQLLLEDSAVGAVFCARFPHAQR